MKFDNKKTCPTLLPLHVIVNLCIFRQFRNKSCHGDKVMLIMQTSTGWKKQYFAIYIYNSALAHIYLHIFASVGGTSRWIWAAGLYQENSWWTFVWNIDRDVNREYHIACEKTREDQDEDEGIFIYLKGTRTFLSIIGGYLAHPNLCICHIFSSNQCWR